MTKDFEMIKVESSSLEAIGWMAEELRVKFLKGGLYSYKPFASLAWVDFKNAESKGKFFYKNIRHNKEITCTKIKGKDDVNIKEEKKDE